MWMHIFPSISLQRNLKDISWNNRLPTMRELDEYS
jgi:hypothetical protein